MRGKEIKWSWEIKSRQLGYNYSRVSSSFNPREREEFLRALDSMEKTYETRWNWERANSSYVEALNRLFPYHATDYFFRVVDLLESNSLCEREAGIESLERCLHWNFGFDRRAFKPIRDEQLKIIRPKLWKLASRTGVEMRVFVLEERGVSLEGDPSTGADGRWVRDGLVRLGCRCEIINRGESWLPGLLKASSSLDPVVVYNVFDILEELGASLRDRRHYFHSLPPDERGRALAAFLKDQQSKRNEK